MYCERSASGCQTAEPLANLLNLEVNVPAAFRERHVGVLEGLTFDKNRKVQFPKDYYALVNRSVHHVITEGESYRHLLRRSTGRTLEIHRSQASGRKDRDIFAYRCEYCFLTLHLMGAIHRTTKQTPWIVTSNCGIDCFELRGRSNVRVLALNDTRHLSSPTGDDSFAAL